MMYILSKIKVLIDRFLNTGHERSVKAKKNILYSFLIKGLSIAISLILVPLTIHYVNPTRYGIWLTLSSIVGWFSFFDIGLTQGLRNRFAAARAKSDDNLAQIYVSTTYAILSIVFIAIWSIFLVVNPFLNWSNLINVTETLQSEISLVAIIVFSYFCFSFIFRIITTILVADQQPAKSSFIDLLGQILSMVLIFILVKTTQGSLINLGLAFCISQLLILIVASLILFNGEYKKFRPLFSKVNFSFAKDLFNLGVVFFVIQVAGIIQFQTANIIISRNFDPAEVTSYNIVFKYFGVLNMIFIIFLTPFWSASTEAFLKNDIDWIRNGVKNYLKLSTLLLLGGLIMLIFSGLIYRLWLGDNTVNITFATSFWGYIYFIVMIFSQTFVFFLNSINALRIQFIACIISSLLYIFLAIFFIRYLKMGVYAIFIASVISNFNAFLLAPIQYHQIINKKKKGIWIK
jgi:O-antigen/teichoic acid export membrane protein